MSRDVGQFIEEFKILCNDKGIKLGETDQEDKNKMSEYVKKDELSEYAKKSEFSEFSEKMSKEFEEKLSKREKELEEKEKKFSETVDAFFVKLSEMGAE